MWREELRKNSEFQMGIEPLTIHTLAGCSNHQTIKTSSDEQVINFVG